MNLNFQSKINNKIFRNYKRQYKSLRKRIKILKRKWNKRIRWQMGFMIKKMIYKILKLKPVFYMDLSNQKKLFQEKMNEILIKIILTQKNRE